MQADGSFYALTCVGSIATSHRGAQGGHTLRPELQPLWAAYAEAAGSHSDWAPAAVYVRESRREQVEGFSPAAQLKERSKRLRAAVCGCPRATCSSI